MLDCSLTGCESRSKRRGRGGHRPSLNATFKRLRKQIRKEKKKEKKRRERKLSINRFGARKLNMSRFGSRRERGSEGR